MVKIKGGGMDVSSIITTIIRYGILLLLTAVSINYIHNANIQYIIFIVLLIIIVLGTGILMKDLLDLGSFTNIVSNIGNKGALNEISLEKSNPTLLQIFMGVIGIGAIMKIISLVFFIIILGDGRKELKSKDFSQSKKMSSYNLNILNQYISYFKYSFLLMIALSILIFIMYGTPETQIIVKNLTALGMSAAILTLVSLEMYHSVQFLRIKDNNGLLYEITESETSSK
jgi:uncharacterized membrane protein YadS